MSPEGPQHYPDVTGGTKRSRRPLIMGVAFVLAVLAAVIVASLLYLRHLIFEQIASRDSDTLAALAAQQYAEDKANDESVTSLADPAEQVELALKITRRLPTVYGVRIFSSTGQQVTAIPVYITESKIDAADLARLGRLKPVTHFLTRADLAGLDLLAETNAAATPLLEISIPLREPGHNQLVGIAQFLIYGASIAQEYALMDRHLILQGALTFFISGSIIAGGVLLAFRRVQRANTLLAERTNNLLKANRELALAAKTSAVGAVTSHLIHGLKNPLSGLRSFVQDGAQGQDSVQESDWQLAAATAQRMQSLIDRVVRVLQEQQTVTEYEITFEELVEILASKIKPVAEAAGVHLSISLSVDGSVSNREADLILLILENLVQNAIEATPAGQAVQLRTIQEQQRIIIEVEDHGPGLRPDVLERLFTPCSSSKKGGSGIGLAISRQLATHLGANLELKHSSPKGCCFRLVLPRPDSRSAPGSAGRKAVEDYRSP